MYSSNSGGILSSNSKSHVDLTVPNYSADNINDHLGFMMFLEPIKVENLAYLWTKFEALDETMKMIPQGWL